MWIILREPKIYYGYCSGVSKVEKLFYSLLSKSDPMTPQSLHEIRRQAEEVHWYNWCALYRQSKNDKEHDENGVCIKYL